MIDPATRLLLERAVEALAVSARLHSTPGAAISSDTARAWAAWRDLTLALAAEPPGDTLEGLAIGDVVEFDAGPFEWQHHLIGTVIETSPSLRVEVARPIGGTWLVETITRIVERAKLAPPVAGPPERGEPAGGDPKCGFRWEVGRDGLEYVTAPTPPAPDKGGDIREPSEPYLASLIRLCDDDAGRITSHVDMAIRTLVAEVRRLRGVDEELRVRIAALREDVAAVTEDLALIREARRHVPEGLAYPGLFRLLDMIDGTAGGST